MFKKELNVREKKTKSEKNLKMKKIGELENFRKTQQCSKMQKIFNVPKKIKKFFFFISHKIMKS